MLWLSIELSEKEERSASILLPFYQMTLLRYLLQFTRIRHLMILKLYFK